MKYSLRESHPLFTHLSKNPTWWQNLKADKDIYCDIRKDNYINVYYNGGSLMRLDYNNNGFRAKIHPEYVPLKGKSDYLNFDFSDAGVTIPNPGVIDIKNFAPAPLSRIKNRIRKFYGKKSEKGIQGSYVTKTLSGKNRYGFFLDTEFEYSVRKKTHRIDLVWVNFEPKGIVFVELKTKNDARLLATAPTDTAVTTQLKEYASYIGSHQRQLQKHYNSVYRIKKKLGLLAGFTRHQSLASFPVLDKPVLLIGDCNLDWIEANALELYSRVAPHVHGLVCQGYANTNFRIPNRSLNHFYGFEG